MGYSQIDLHIAEGIATLTLNRPDKMNAFTGTMMNEIIDAMDRTDADDAVRAVIFTGAGERACPELRQMAGHDVSSFILRRAISSSLGGVLAVFFTKRSEPSWRRS